MARRAQTGTRWSTQRQLEDRLADAEAELAEAYQVIEMQAKALRKQAEDAERLMLMAGYGEAA